MEASERPPLHSLTWPLLALAGIAVLNCLFPGDAPWILDEPQLIQNAMVANANGALASHGLHGTQGAFYGPLPTWIYQGYLLVSTNMVALVALRAALFTLLTGSALLVIAKLARLPAWAMLLALLAPYFWLYSRQIWDNSFSFPLAAWTFAGYALFLSGRRWGISLFVLCAGLLVLVHLMGVPLIAAIALHALITQRRQLLSAVWYILIPLVAVALVGIEYWPVLLDGLRSGPPLVMPSLAALLFTLGGGNWFGGPSFISVVGREWFSHAPAILRGLLLAMIVLLPLGFVGIATGMIRLIRAGRNAAPWTLADQLSAVALLALLLQFLYFGVRNAIGHIHYYNVSWIAYAFLIGVFCQWLSRWRLGRAVVAVVVACAACTLLAIILQIHRTGGTRSLTYGPALANQQAVARTLAQLPQNSNIVPLVPDIASIPGRIQVLAWLDSSLKPTPGPAQTAYIVYASENPADGRIRAELAAPGSSAPGSVPATTPHQSAPITR